MPAVKEGTPKIDDPKTTPNQRVQGLPVAQANDHDFFHDIRMDTARGLTSVGMPDVHMNTARGYTFGHDDVRMDTARGTLKPGGFKMWEMELLESPEVRRKGTVAQLCECVAKLASYDPTFIGYPVRFS
jgi:cell cycle protein kinase DBF2